MGNKNQSDTSCFVVLNKELESLSVLCQFVLDFLQGNHLEWKLIIFRNDISEYIMIAFV